MKTFLQAWWRGVGVFGLYLAISIVGGAVCYLPAALPKNLQLTLGIPFLILFAPPLLYWTFRWVYPEAAAPKSSKT
jgi:hypothetical protein